MLGDRWSLLIIRDLMFAGRRTYKEFLESGEGIATNILADRLETLEANRIVTTHPDPGDGRKVIYRLTKKGIDLAPVLVDLIVWASKYEDTAAPAAIIRRAEHDRQNLLLDIEKKWLDNALPADRRD